MTISPAQCRAGRALLNWPQAKLAAVAKVARSTLADFEIDRRMPYPRTMDDIRGALEAAGVIFVAENGEGPGVRLRKVQSEPHPVG